MTRLENHLRDFEKQLVNTSIDFISSTSFHRAAVLEGGTAGDRRVCVAQSVVAAAGRWRDDPVTEARRTIARRGREKARALEARARALGANEFENQMTKSNTIDWSITNHQTLLFSTTRTRSRIFRAIQTRKSCCIVICGAPRTRGAVDNSVENSQKKRCLSAIFSVASADALRHKPLMKFAAHRAAGSWS